VDKDAEERARQSQSWWKRALSKVNGLFGSGGQGREGSTRAGGDGYEGPTVSVRPIKLGPSRGERVAVEEGLAVGDGVVTDGGDRLKDGAKVVLPDAVKEEGKGTTDAKPNRRRAEGGGGPPSG